MLNFRAYSTSDWKEFVTLPSAITDPIALSAYALSLVFGAAGTARVGKGSKAKWQMGAAYGLALLCIIGGLALGFHRDAVKTEPVKPELTAPVTPVQPPNVKIEGNQQTTCTGNNVINAGGTVTTAATAGQGQSANCTQVPAIGPSKASVAIPAPTVTPVAGHTK